VTKQSPPNPRSLPSLALLGHGRGEKIEDAIVRTPELLRRLGPDLEIRGRQLVCTGHGGRIDLLAYDKKRRCFIVIELKNVRASQNTFGQIATYLGWAGDRLPAPAAPRGIVVARGFDARFQAALKTTDRIEFVDLSSLGFD
jgi:RecB family endonuclease NucS